MVLTDSAIERPWGGRKPIKGEGIELYSEVTGRVVGLIYRNEDAIAIRDAVNKEASEK